MINDFRKITFFLFVILVSNLILSLQQLHEDGSIWVPFNSIVIEDFDDFGKKFIEAFSEIKTIFYNDNCFDNVANFHFVFSLKILSFFLWIYQLLKMLKNIDYWLGLKDWLVNAFIFFLFLCILSISFLTFCLQFL